MAYGLAENPARSAGALLDAIDYPAARETLVEIAMDSEAPADLINLFKTLPQARYERRDLVDRDLAEAARRFAMGGSRENDGARRDRRNIGKDAIEGAPEGMTRHP